MLCKVSRIKKLVKLVDCNVYIISSTHNSFSFESARACRKSGRDDDDDDDVQQVALNWPHALLLLHVQPPLETHRDIKRGRNLTYA